MLPGPRCKPREQPAPKSTRAVGDRSSRTLGAVPCGRGPVCVDGRIARFGREIYDSGDIVLACRAALCVTNCLDKNTTRLHEQL